MDLNPEPPMTRIQLQSFKWKNQRKSHSHCHFLPNHTTSCNKQSFISEPNQSQRRLQNGQLLRWGKEIA